MSGCIPPRHRSVANSDVTVADYEDALTAWKRASGKGGLMDIIGPSTAKDFRQAAPPHDGPHESWLRQRLLPHEPHAYGFAKDLQRRYEDSVPAKPSYITLLYVDGSRGLQDHNAN